MKTERPGRWFLIRNPMIYQGGAGRKNYFEGWYFKIVDPHNELAVAFIPGIVWEENGTGHCFVQVLDGINCHSHYFDFDIDQFNPTKRSLEIEIQGNKFSERGISFTSADISANIKFGNWNKFKSSLLRPGIMGWYAYMPFMECYHGLGSMYHDVTGYISITGRKVTLTQAAGYVEKDWGTSFPKSWIWTQCNTFKRGEQLSVFASVAHIPWRGSFFIGFLAVLWIEGKMEVFTTYNDARKDVNLVPDGVSLKFEKKRKVLEILVHKAPGAELRSPISGNMRGKVNESLQATMTLKFFRNTECICQAEGRFAGLEVAGPVEILLDP